MPIYEYSCEKCGEITEAIQKFSDEPLTVCKCGGKLKKIMSNNSFILKGDGWFASNPKKKPKKVDKPAAST